MDEATRRGEERYAKPKPSPVEVIDEAIAKLTAQLANPEMHERDVWAARVSIHVLYEVRRAVTG